MSIIDVDQSQTFFSLNPRHYELPSMSRLLFIYFLYSSSPIRVAPASSMGPSLLVSVATSV